MVFRVLGPLEVDVDGVPTSVSGTRARALMTALLLRPNSVASASWLVEALWGDRPPENAANALHQVVGRLRTQLGSVGASIVTRPPGYVLVVGESGIDADRFAAGYRATRAVAATDPAQAATLLDEALAWWRGPAYGEFADGFALAASAGLEELRVAALEQRAALALATGQAAEAVAGARDLVGQWPLRERPVEILMRALHADGRAGEALEAFRRHREVVAEELGLDPGPALRALEAGILRDDPSLPAPSQIQAAPGPPAGYSPGDAAAEQGSRALPWRPGPMLGRDRELALLLGCVGSARLVTLVGPGGVGKTRLALQAAHELAGRSPVWWVELSAVPAVRLVDALAEAMGVEIPRTADLAGSLCSTVRAHRGVLCLDNAEHLLPVIAPVLEQLLDAAPELAAMATTRERLAIGPEHVHVVTPLPVPGTEPRDNSAVRLFVARAPGLEADRLTAGEVALVAELCRRLDGLPLAIELGAACASNLGLRALSDRLGQRLDLLSGGRRTAAARHRTLRAVVDWSHELLSADEAVLLARLSVFPGAFSLGQAESVCADGRIPGPAVAPLLARLVEQSLVQVGDGRFWLLETLSAYAAERLEPRDQDLVRGRHANDTADRLSHLRADLATPHEDAAVAALTALEPDLHAAWAYAAEHDAALGVRLAGAVFEYAYYRQRLDLLDWGRRVAGWDAPDLVDVPSLPDAVAAGAAASWAAGLLDQAGALADRGVAVAGGPDSPAAAHATNQQGCVAMFAGRVQDAAALFERAAALHRVAGEPVRALLCAISVWQALSYANRATQAGAARAEQSLRSLRADAETVGNPTALAWAHYVSGEALADVDVQRASAAYTAAVDAACRVNNRLFATLARSSAVRLAARHGPVPQALTELERISDQWEDLGNEAAQWWLLFNLFVLLVRAGSDRDSAVLAGAVQAARNQHPAFPRDLSLFDRELDRVRERWGAAATDAALAEGAAMPYADAVAYARRALRTAGRRLRENA